MPINDDLARILGKDAVLDDDTTLKKYSFDQSFVEPRKPDVVAYAKTVEEIQEIVKYANKTRTPIVPFSSGLNLHGGTIPKEGGIILNLSRMKQIQIDDNNWHAVIEPGVTVSHGSGARPSSGLPPGGSTSTSVTPRASPPPMFVTVTEYSIV